MFFFTLERVVVKYHQEKDFGLRNSCVVDDVYHNIINVGKFRYAILLVYTWSHQIYNNRYTCNTS
jgi:hypothetical protein